MRSPNRNQPKYAVLLCTWLLIVDISPVLDRTIVAVAIVVAVILTFMEYFTWGVIAHTEVGFIILH